MQNILLVDAMNDIQGQLTSVIQPDVSLIHVKTAKEALCLIEQNPIQLIATEIDLEDENGIEFCRRLKQTPATKRIPVIFVTHRASLKDRIEGFEAGAEDYVLKPFEPIELALRIGARLRANLFASVGEPQQKIKINKISLSVPFQRAFLEEDGKDQDLHLTPTEFKLLYFFIQNKGEVLTRDQLLKTVWDGDENVMTRTIDKHISTLKKKLKSEARFIQSVHSKGYRFSETALDAKKA